MPIKPAYSCSEGAPETGTGSEWDGRRAGGHRELGELEENSVFLPESAVWPRWDGTSCGCWHRGVNSADGQWQRLMVVAGGEGGRKGKTIKCKNQVFYVSALMVVVSHGHAEEPLYSFPRSSSVVPFTMWLIITGRVCIISVMMYR